MKKLTDDKAAELARRCNEKYRANGKEVNPQSEIYVRLNDYERFGKSPEALGALIRKLDYVLEAAKAQRKELEMLKIIVEGYKIIHERSCAFWDGEYFDEVSEEYRAPCSMCGNEMQSSTHIDGYVKFCPNCGAVMKTNGGESND